MRLANHVQVSGVLKIRGFTVFHFYILEAPDNSPDNKFSSAHLASIMLVFLDDHLFLFYPIHTEFL